MTPTALQARFALVGYQVGDTVRRTDYVNPRAPKLWQLGTVVRVEPEPAAGALVQGYLVTVEWHGLRPGLDRVGYWGADLAALELVAPLEPVKGSP